MAEQGIFIKVTDRPNGKLSREDKVILNRKANAMFNEGNIEAARRLYTTTGYSDGLTRVGDKYMSKKKPLRALKQYILAHNDRKTDEIYGKVATLISALISEDRGAYEDSENKKIDK